MQKNQPTKKQSLSSLRKRFDQEGFRQNVTNGLPQYFFQKKSLDT